MFKDTLLAKQIKLVRALSMTYPSIDRILKGSNRAELLCIMRSPLSLIPNIILFLLLIFLLLLANLYLPQYLQYIPIISSFSLRWLGIIPLLVLLETARRYYNDLYVLGEVSIFRKTGRLSLNYSVPSVRYTDIRGIFVFQPFWGRVFGYGHVYVGTAAQGDAELSIEFVSAPYQLARLIENFREYNLHQKN